MSVNSLVYVTAPYSLSSPIEDRVKTYQLVCLELTKLLISNKESTYYTPIIGRHIIANLSQQDLLSSTYTADKILKGCSELIVLKLPGYGTDESVMQEVLTAEVYGIPVIYKEA